MVNPVPAQVSASAPLVSPAPAGLARSAWIALLAGYLILGDQLTRTPLAGGLSASAFVSLTIGFCGLLAILQGAHLAPPIGHDGRRLLRLWSGLLALFVFVSVVRLPRQDYPWSMVQSIQQIWAWVYYGLTIAATFVLFSAVPMRRYGMIARRVLLTLSYVAALLSIWMLTVKGTPALASLGIIGPRPLAATLAISGMAALFTRHNPVVRWTTVLLVMAALMVSGSRMATVAFVFGGTVGLLADVSLAKPRSWRSLLALVPILLAVAIGFAATDFGTRLADLASGASSIAADPLSNDAAELTQGRAVAWPQVFLHASERWILGHGAGSGSAFTFLVTSNTRFEHPHNEYLRHFHDVGVVGLGLFLAFFLVIATTALREVRRQRDGFDNDFLVHSVSAVALSATAAVLLLFLTDNIGFYAYVMAAHAVVIGLLVARPPSTGG